MRVVVPFPAGGSTDRMTRLVADELTRVFKQQFVVENRPGAGGAVGAAQVARADADGYTLMAGGFGPHILGPASGVKADYDPIADFTHIVMMGGETYIFGAHSALGVKTIADVVRLANDKPVNFGSPGTGTLGQLMVDQFRLKVGADQDQPRSLSRRRAVADRFYRQPCVAGIAADRADAAAYRDRHGRRARGELDRTQSRAPGCADAEGSRLSGDRRCDLVLAGRTEASSDPIVDRVNKEVRRYLATAPVQQIFVRDALMRMDTDAAALNQFIAGEIKRWSAIYREIEPRNEEVILPHHMRSHRVHARTRRTKVSLASHTFTKNAPSPRALILP